MQSEQSAAVTLTVDIIVFTRDGQVLLIKRESGMWALPGGQPRPGELLAETAKRALLEQTWLDTAIPAFQSRIYPRRGNVVSTAFIACLNQDAADVAPYAGFDATEARWFPWRDVPELACDHKTMIEDALLVPLSAVERQRVPASSVVPPAGGMTLKHLSISLDYLARQTPAFLAGLAAYLARPEDPTGLRVYNLRQQAQSFSQSFTQIDGLLAMLDPHEGRV